MIPFARTGMVRGISITIRTYDCTGTGGHHCPGSRFRGAVLQQVSTTLEKAGFAVFTALDGTAIRDFCHETKNPVQLAIIDSAMGTGDPELVRELCECHPRVRVLFTGSQDEPTAIQEGFPDGHSCSLGRSWRAQVFSGTSHLRVWLRSAAAARLAFHPEDVALPVLVAAGLGRAGGVAAAQRG